MVMSGQSPTPGPEPLDLSPSKDTYQSIQSDVTPIGAVKELIDNAIDNWERVHSRQSDLEINITYDPEENLFEISDNSGGLEEEHIGKLFALGESTKADIDTPIGAYGVGAKKAIVKLGREAELRSHYEEQEYGYGFEIDEEWLYTPDDWVVEKRPYQDLSTGETVITIRDLKLDLDEAEEELDNIVDADDGINTEEFLDGVRQQLSQTYEKFLQPSGNFDGDLTIKLNNDPVPTPNDIDWSYTPFDGFHPRSYDNITLHRHNLDHDVFLTVCVGLMTTADDDEAGTDIFCQNRKIITGNSGAIGGYGQAYTENLGEVGPSRGRLKVRLYFETEGDADRLPWDTKKNDVDEFDSLMQEAYWWMDKIVQPYWRASRYDSLPRAFVEPYGINGDWAAHKGQFEHFDYSGQQRHTKKPNQDFQDKNSIQQSVQKHLDIGISAPKLIDEKFRPAYNSIIDDVDFDSNERPIKLPECPIGKEDRELAAMADQVRKIARDDANKGQRRDVANEWWEPIYTTYLNRHSNQEINSLHVVDEDGSIQSQKEIDDLVQEPTEEKDEETSSKQAELGSQSSSPAQKSDSPKASGASQTDVSDANEAGVSDPSTPREGAQPVNESAEVSEDSEQGKSSTGKNKTVGLLESTRTPQGPQYPAGHRIGKADPTSVVLDFSSETWDALCDHLGVEPDAEKDYISDELKMAIKSELLDMEPR